MKNKKLGLIIVGAVLISGLAFAGFRSFNAPSPKEQLRGAEKKTLTADSYSMDIEMNTETEGNLQSTISFTGKLNYDRLKERADLSTNIDVSGEGMVLNLGGHLKYIEDKLYGKVTTFPYLALPIGSEQVDMITENEILISDNTNQDLSLLLEDGLRGTDLEGMSLTEILDEADKLREKMWQEEIITISQSENVDLDDRESKKYSLQIDGEKMTDFYMQLADQYQLVDPYSELSDRERDELKAELEKAYQEMDIKAWVVDDYLVKLEVDSSTDFSDQLEGEGEDEFPEKVKTTFIINFDNFNQDFEIEEPEEYMGLKDLLEELQLFPILDLNSEEIES